MIARATILGWDTIDALSPLGCVLVRVVARDSRFIDLGASVTLSFDVHPRTYRIMRTRVHGVNGWEDTAASTVPFHILDLVETVAREQAPRLMTPPSRR